LLKAEDLESAIEAEPYFDSTFSARVIPGSREIATGTQAAAKLDMVCGDQPGQIIPAVLPNFERLSGGNGPERQRDSALERGKRSRLVGKRHATSAAWR
jgi:hypothetical protein